METMQDRLRIGSMCETGHADGQKFIETVSVPTKEELEAFIADRLDESTGLMHYYYQGFYYAITEKPLSTIRRNPKELVQ